MTLCPECVDVANRKLLEERIKVKGIHPKEDNHWSQNYNKAHRTHTTAPQPKGRK